MIKKFQAFFNKIKIKHVLLKTKVITQAVVLQKSVF